MFEFQILNYELPEDPNELSIELIAQEHSMQLYKKERPVHSSLPSQDPISVSFPGTIFIKFTHNSATSGVLFPTEFLSQITAQYLPIFTPPKQIDYLEDSVEAPRVLIVNPQNEENVEDSFSNLSFQLYQKYVELKASSQKEKTQLLNEIKMLEVEVDRCTNEYQLQKALKEDIGEELETCWRRKEIVKGNMEAIVADIEAQKCCIERELEIEKMKRLAIEKAGKEEMLEAENWINKLVVEVYEADMKKSEIIETMIREKLDKLKAESKVKKLDNEKHDLVQRLHIEQLKASAKSCCYDFYSIFKGFIASETKLTLDNVIEHYEEFTAGLHEKYNLSLMELQNIEEKLRQSEESSKEMKFKFEEKLYRKKERRSHMKQELKELNEKFTEKVDKGKAKKTKLKADILELISNNEALNARLKSTIEDFETKISAQENKYTDEVNSYEITILGLTQANLQLRTEIEELLRSSALNLEEKANQAEYQLLEAQQNYDEKLKDFNQLHQDSLKTLETEILNQRSSFELIIQSQKESILAFENDIALKTIQIDSLTQTKKQLESHIDETQRLFDNTHVALQQESEKYFQTVEEFKTRIEDIKKSHERQLSNEKSKSEESHKLLEYEIKQLRSEILSQEQEKSLLTDNFTKVKDYLALKVSEIENENFILNQKILELEKRYKQDMVKERNRFDEYRAERDEMYNLLEKKNLSVKMQLESDIEQLNKELSKTNENKIKEMENYTQIVQELRENSQLELQRTEMNYEIITKELEGQITSLNRNLLDEKLKYEKDIESIQIELYKLQELKQLGENELRNENTRLQALIKDTKKRMKYENSELLMENKEMENRFKVELESKQDLISKMEKDCSLFQQNILELEKSMKSENERAQVEYQNKQHELNLIQSELQEKINLMKKEIVSAEETSAEKIIEANKLNASLKEAFDEKERRLREEMKESLRTQELFMIEKINQITEDFKGDQEKIKVEHDRLYQDWLKKEEAFKNELSQLESYTKEKEISLNEINIKLKSDHKKEIDVIQTEHATLLQIAQEEKELKMKIHSELLVAYNEKQKMLENKLLATQHEFEEKENYYKNQYASLEADSKQHIYELNLKYQSLQQSYESNEAKFIFQISKLQELSRITESSLKENLINLQETHLETTANMKADLANTIKTYEEKLATMKSEHNKLRTIYEEKEKKLKNEFRLMKERYQELEINTANEITEHQTEKLSLKEENQRMKETQQEAINSLNCEYEKLKEAKSLAENEMRNEYARLQESSSIIENKMKNDYEKLIEVSQERERVYKSEYSKLQEILQEKEKTMKNEYNKMVQIQCEKEKETKSKFDLELITKNTEICKLKTEILNLESRLKDLAQKSSTDQQQFSTSLKLLENDKSLLQDKIFTLEKDLILLETQKETTLRSFHEFKQLKDQEEANYKKEHSLTLLSLSKASKDIEALTTSISDSRHQYTLLEDELKAHKKSSESSLQAQKSHHKSKRLSLKTQIAELTTSLSNSQQKSLDLEQQISSLISSFSSKESLLSSQAASQLQDFNTRTKSLQDKIKSLQSQLENSSSVIIEYSNKLQFILKECEDHSAAYTELKSKNASLEEAVGVLRESLRAKSEEIEALENAVQATKADKKNSTKEILSILSSHNPSDPETVDRMLNAYLLANNTANNFIRIADGVYSHKNKKVGVCIKNGSIVIRVGGGYMFIDEFLRQHVDESDLTLRRSHELKKSSTENTSEDCVYDFSNPINGLSSSLHLPKNSCKTPIKRII